jgi:hypothetical protein
MFQAGHIKFLTTTFLYVNKFHAFCGNKCSVRVYNGPRYVPKHLHSVHTLTHTVHRSAMVTSRLNHFMPVVTVCAAARFNIQQFYVLPTQCIYVFCVDLRTNSDYFPIQD